MEHIISNWEGLFVNENNRYNKNTAVILFFFWGGGGDLFCKNSNSFA